MISTLNDIKKGSNIIQNNEPYVVLDARFVKMQMRKPVMQTKLRNLISGKVMEVNFHQGDKVAEADLMRKKVDYLYHDNQNFYFMSPDDFEQFALTENLIGDAVGYLKEGNKIEALYFNGNPVAISCRPKWN